MLSRKQKAIEAISVILVLLMVLLQAGYAIYAYIEPLAFSLLRGTELYSANDSDWIQIYASRTLFIAAIIGVLLILKEYKLLLWSSILGTLMPITDAFLAYQAGAENTVIYKHVATIVYLLITFFFLKLRIEHK